MHNEDNFDKYLNDSEFASHNYIGSGAFNLNGINTPGDNVNGLPEYMGVSLDQFNGIDSSYNIGNDEGALAGPTYLNEACINQNLGCTQSRRLIDNTIGSLSEPMALLDQYPKFGYTASKNCFTGDVLRIGSNWINEGNSAMQTEPEYINADISSLDPVAIAHDTANTQFQDTGCLICGTVNSGIEDESKSLEKDINGFEIDTPGFISELVTSPSNSLLLSDITGTSHLLTKNPSYLSGIPFEKLDKNTPEVVVNSFEQTSFCADHRVMGTGSISYPNNNSCVSFLNQKGSNHNFDFAQAHPEQVHSDYKSGPVNDSILYSDVERLNTISPISGSLVSFAKGDSISGFRDLSISSQKKIEGIVENILPEQIGQVEFGVNFSTEQNNYTLNILIFINGDISGDKSQIGHIFNFN